MEVATDVEIIKREVENDIVFSLREDGIFCTDCLPDTVMTIEKGLFSTKKTSEMQDGVPYPLLCDLTNVVKMTKECRDHFAGVEHGETFTRAALVVSNPISRIIGNFFMGLNKPVKPTRLFTDKTKAIEWLKSTN